MSRTNDGKRFLIVGATGNIGSLVATVLLDRGERVRCLVRDADRAISLKESGAEVAVGDLDREDTLPDAFDGIDSVFFVTATNPNAEQQANAGIRIARASGVGHFVRYSAVKIPGAPQLRSASMHEAADVVLETSGLKYTHVRPSHYMQNLLLAAPMTQSESTIRLPYGDGKIALMDLRDMSEVVVKVLTTEGHYGKTFSITGPRSVTIREAAEAISDAIGQKVSYVDLPPESWREFMQSAGMDQWSIDEYLAYFDAFRNNHADIVTNDYQELMHRPPRSIEDFARDYAPIFNPALSPVSVE